MCRTDSSFLGLLGLGLLRVFMQDRPLAKRKQFIKLLKIRDMSASPYSAKENALPLSDE